MLARAMIGPVLTYDDIRAIAELGSNAQLATVERWARKIGLRYNYNGRGGIWTTVDALNASLGLKADSSDDAAPYDPESVI